MFAAMLCRDDGGNGWAAIGQILETRGADCVPTWLGNHGEVRCCWLHNEPNEPHSMRYVKTEDAAADAVWYPAALFLRKVAMLARRDGSFTLAAPDANAIINSVWAYNLGHFREGHVKEVGGGGELQGSRPMLSRMLRDAVHLALHDDRVKRGSARVDSVPRSDFVALMASKRQYKKNAKNERQLLYAFSDVRQLDSVLGGHGWEAVYHVGDAGINIVVTNAVGPCGRKQVKRPVRVSFLEKKHATHGLRGYGHVLISFVFDWDKDDNRRLINI